nr:MAG TPA: hypothetical protein [Caudoviricetes sp.]
MLFYRLCEICIRAYYCYYSYCSHFFRALALTISLYTFLFLGLARYCP